MDAELKHRTNMFSEKGGQIFTLLVLPHRHQKNSCSLFLESII